jgi:5-methylthioadenosine/S-adenosylhomocysteine deaminase
MTMQRESGEMDILIRGGTVLTMSGDSGIVHGAVVGIKGEKIAFVEKDEEPPSRRYQARDVMEARGCLILPGLVNTHTHLPMVAFRGMADDLPLMEWLSRHIFPAEAKYVNRQMVYDTARLAIAEMILSGTTTFCDGYFYESGIARAAMECGMRAVPSAGFIDLPFPDSPDPSNHTGIAGKYLARWKDRSPLITPALFCHSPYTCKPETIRVVKEAARKAGVPFLTHLAETKEEVRITKELYGLTPVRHLHRLGVLDEKTIAIHAVWVDDEEIEILGDCGVKVSHCPESNMKLASGICPLTKLIGRGIAVGLGTDGAASNNDLDMFGEMDKAAKVDKVVRMDPTIMGAETVLRMATIDGAAVLGLEKEIGSLEPGKRADIIILDTRKPHLTPLYNPYSHIVYSASGADVKTAIINGKVVMRDRRLTTLDVDEAMAKVVEIADAIKKDLPSS